MKDLSARWQLLPGFPAFVAILALIVMPGCTALDAQSAAANNSPLRVSSSNLNFGTVLVGNRSVLTNTIVNTTFARITLTRASVNQSDFTLSGPELPMTLAPGQSAFFSVTYTPQSQGSSSGTVFIAASATALSTFFTVSGTAVSPATLTVSPSSIGLGSVPLGNTKTQTATISNSGGMPLIITQATVSGKGFQLSGLSLPVTLRPSQSTQATVTFTSTLAGPQSGTLSVVAAVVTPVQQPNFAIGRFFPRPSPLTTSVSVPLSASGAAATGQLAAAPAAVNVGNVMVGSSQAQTASLTNTGTASVTINQAAVSGAGFRMSGLNTPMTLGAGQSVNFAVTFAPSSSGSSNGSVSITSNAANPVLNMALTGSGVMPGALSANPSSVSFSNAQVGSTQTIPVTLTNTGGMSISVSQAGISGTGLSVTGLALPLSVGAGQSASFGVVFAPKNAGPVSGTLSLTSNASNATLALPVTGNAMTAGALTAAQAGLNFGNVQVGNSQVLAETLTNTGGSSVTISQDSITGSGFNVSGLSLPFTLNAGQSVNFNVTFAPQAGGTAAGSLGITSNASNSLGISLTGTGVTAGALGTSSSSLSFGNVQVGATQTMPETLTNSGGSSLTVNQAIVSGSGFSASGLNLPMTLNAGQSTSFNVVFAPQAGGSASGSISISSNASNSALNISLGGTGVTQGALSAASSGLSFGNVQVGATQSLSETLTNSGGSSVTVSQANVSGSSFSVSGLNLPMTLNAGQSTSFNVVFAPQAGGSATGSISIASTASNSTLSISLAGSGITPGSLAVSPSSLSFGSVQAGSSQTLSETLTNSGGTSISVSQATASGPGFGVTGLSLPLTLAPGQSFTFGVGFTPTSSGNASGSISITSNASNSTLTIALSGTGAAAGQLTASPGSLSFGSVVVGQNSSLPASLTASGSTVTVSAAQFGTSEFTLSGISFPLTIAAGQQVSFQVVFTPQSSGSASDSVSFLSNASNSPALESLGGTGTAAPQHSVSLSWTGGSNVAGYNIYRSTASGTQGTLMNSSLDPSPEFTDTSVQAGQTYYYETTAVNSNGMESAPSNQVKAAIPTP